MQPSGLSDDAQQIPLRSFQSLPSRMHWAISRLVISPMP